MPPIAWLCAVDTHLAILAGRRGDADVFRQKAQTISGYVRGNSRIFGPEAFLPLVEPAVLVGNIEAAKGFLRQGRGSNRNRDQAAASLAVEMIRQGQTDAARSMMQELRQTRAVFRVQMALAQAEGNANLQDLWRRLQTIDELRNSLEKAAAYAAVGLALTNK